MANAPSCTARRSSTIVPSEDWALQPVHVDTWGGWVFVNPGADPEPLLQWLDPLPTLLGPFRLEDMRYRWRKRVVVPANWKTVIDAFIEGYHTPGTHPQVLRPFEGTEPSSRPALIDEYPRAPFAPTFTLPQPRGLEVRRAHRAGRAQPRLGRDDEST